MIFNKIGGGSEKVTLDGKTVTKRYNFITSEKIKKICKQCLIVVVELQ